MPVTFSLDSADYKRLERAVTVRFLRKHGRFNIAFFAQVFAWMFITIAAMTFYKQWEQSPEVAQGYGVVLLFAVLGFLFASARPLAGLWLYRKYVAASNESFAGEQSVDIVGRTLVLNSSTGMSTVPRSAIIDHSEDELNHYLFVTGVQAITIPKTAAAALGPVFLAFLAAPPGEA